MICHHNIETPDGCKLCWKERAEAACATAFSERLRMDWLSQCTAGEWEALQNIRLSHPKGYLRSAIDAVMPDSFVKSTSCGQGWLSPDKAKVLVEALEHIAKWTPVSSHMRITDAPELAMKALAAAKGEQK